MSSESLKTTSETPDHSLSNRSGSVSLLAARVAMGLTLDLPNASKPLIEGMFQRIDREGVAKLIEQSQQIETKVRRLWNAEKFEQAATYITDQLSWIHEMTRAYIPEAADEELKLRRYSCWPGGCVSGSSDAEIEQKEELINERYKSDSDVLEVRHPRAIEKEWTASQKLLEDRYKRDFGNREEFYLMGVIFESFSRFADGVQELGSAVELIEKFRSKTTEGDPDVHDDVLYLWRYHHLAPRVQNAMISLMQLFQDLIKPGELLELKWSDNEKRGVGWEATEEDLLSLSGHQATFHREEVPAWQIWREELGYATGLLMEADKGVLTFRKAFNTMERRFAEQAGTAIGKRPTIQQASSLPGFLQKKLYNFMQVCYQNRDNDEDMQTFLDWYIGLILERWTSTGPDYNQWVHFHVPSWYAEQPLINLFWTIRDGKPPEEGDTRAAVGRLPQLLWAMVEDGVITREQTDPYLLENYPGPGDIIGGTGVGGVAVRELELKFSQPKKCITLSPSETDLAQPMELALRDSGSSLAELGDLLEPSGEYYVLYNGDHSLLITSDHRTPGGAVKVGDIFRFSKLEPESNTSNTRRILLGGTQFIVRSQRVLAQDRVASNEMASADSEFPAIKTYSVIIDCGKEEFQAKYYQDFLAHVLSHRPHMNASDMREEMQRVEEFAQGNLEEFRTVLGHYAGRTRFRMLMHDGRVGFSIDHDHVFGHEIVVVIAKSLIEYLDDVGLSHHAEIYKDESGRALQDEQQRQGEFQDEHMDEVLERLRGDGLVHALCYGSERNKEKYHERHLLPYPMPCKHCGQTIIGGFIRCPGGEHNGFCASELHDLTHHSETFENRGSFDEIVPFLREVTPIEPTFIKHPEIMPLFTQFANIYSDYREKMEADFNHWDTNVGHMASEEEDLEDNEQMRDLEKQQHELEEAMIQAHDRSREIVMELHTCYQRLSNDEIEIEHSDDSEVRVQSIENFWAGQLVLYSIYQHEGAHLLTTGHPGVDVPRDKISSHWEHGQII